MGDQLSVIEIDTLVMDDLPLYQVNQPVILMQCGYGDEKRGLGKHGECPDNSV